MPSVDDVYDTRAPSLGGYGSLVPFHGTTVFDESAPGESRYIALRNDRASPDDVLDHVADVTTHLRAQTQPGQLFYTFHCDEFGFSASGLDQLSEDIDNPFQLADDLNGTLEDRYGRTLRVHRPCFTVLTGVEGGLFWLLLRGGKEMLDDDGTEWNVMYFVKSGILIDDPVASWPNVEAIIDTDGGPIQQHETDVTTASVRTDERALEEVYPLDQAGTGDADIISARNPFQASDVDSEDGDIRQAVDQTQHLTYRVQGGTIGFEKEAEFRVTGMSAFSPEEITMWGHPLVICRPHCKAIPSN